MSNRLLFAGANQALPPGSTYVLTYSSNVTVTIPLGVTTLTTVKGRGGPAYMAPGDGLYDTYVRVIVTYDSPAWGSDSDTGPQYAGRTTGTPPADYCTAYYNSTARKTTTTCYDYVTTGMSLYSGPAATGFGLNFPGGTSLNQTANVIYPDVVVTPGASYNLVIPTGGSIEYKYVL